MRATQTSLRLRMGCGEALTAWLLQQPRPLATRREQRTTRLDELSGGKR
jgi:hypothetical protein